MPYSIQLSDLKRIFLLSILIIYSTGCTTSVKKNVATIDPTRVNKIQLLFDNSSDSLSKSLPSAEISSRVSANLVHVGYPVSTAQNTDYSHDLIVKIGAIKQNSSTPVGFSFSAGDSDPRGENFQKANVLPITCTLTSRDQQQNRAEYTMDFASKKFTRYGQQADEQTKLAAKLVDDMSTTCFNLLSNLKIKTQKRKSKLKLMSKRPSTASQKSASPKSAPGTASEASDSLNKSPAIETQQNLTNPAPSLNTENSKPESPTSTSGAVSQEPESSNPVSPTASQNTTNPDPDPEYQNPDTADQNTESLPADTLTPENTTESGWWPSIIIVNDTPGESASDSSDDEGFNSGKGRKQLIIHNEGSPLILEMGHDRR